MNSWTMTGIFKIKHSLQCILHNKNEEITKRMLIILSVKKLSHLMADTIITIESDGGITLNSVQKVKSWHLVRNRKSGELLWTQ
jgi:hypothetical protein